MINNLNTEGSFERVFHVRLQQWEKRGSLIGCRSIFLLQYGLLHGNCNLLFFILDLIRAEQLALILLDADFKGLSASLSSWQNFLMSLVFVRLILLVSLHILRHDLIESLFYHEICRHGRSQVAGALNDSPRLRLGQPSSDLL